MGKSKDVEDVRFRGLGMLKGGMVYHSHEREVSGKLGLTAGLDQELI